MKRLSCYRLQVLITKTDLRLATIHGEIMVIDKRSYRLQPEGLNLANSILLQGGEITKPITYKQITEP